MKRNKINAAKVIMLFIVVCAVFYFFQNDWNNVSSKSLNKPMKVENISNVQMAKAVYTKTGGGSRVNFEDVELKVFDKPEDLKRFF